MRVPKPIINGGEQWLALAMQRFRALKASASPLHTRTQIIQPDQDTTIEVHVSPSVDRIKIDSNGLEVSSGLVNIGTLSLPTDPPTPRKFSRFYPGSIQAAPDKRAWVDTAKLNFRVADGLPPQISTIRSTMFTGAMEKVVSVALGANKPIPWGWKWNRTHGVHFDSLGKPWLIEVSVTNGVIAMRFPQSRGLKPKAAESGICQSLGFLPGFTSFPSTSEKLEEGIKEGVIIRLASPSALDDYFNKSPIDEDIGWAFNPSGSECQNILRSEADRIHSTFRFKITIETSESGPVGATLSLIDSGMAYGVRRYSGYEEDGIPYRYCDGSRFFVGRSVMAEPDQAPAMRLDYTNEIAFESLPSSALLGATKDAPSLAPLFVFYDKAGVEKVVHQSIFQFEDIDRPTVSGMPSIDLVPYNAASGSSDFLGATYGCDFVGSDVPPYAHATYDANPKNEPIFQYLGLSKEVSFGSGVGFETQAQAEQYIANQRARYDPNPNFHFSRSVITPPSPGYSGWSAIFYYLCDVRARGTYSGNQPQTLTYQTNSLFVSTLDRSSFFILHNEPSCRPSYRMTTQWLSYEAAAGVDGNYGWSPYIPSSVDESDLIASFRALQNSNASGPTLCTPSGQLINVSRDGVRSNDLGGWLNAESALSSADSWWLKIPGLFILVPDWQRRYFASLAPDFAPLFDLAFSLYSGRSAFLSSSFCSKAPDQAPSGQDGSVIDGLANDGEPLDLTERTPTGDSFAKPLMLGWVGYS